LIQKVESGHKTGVSWTSSSPPSVIADFKIAWDAYVAISQHPKTSEVETCRTAWMNLIDAMDAYKQFHPYEYRTDKSGYEEVYKSALDLAKSIGPELDRIEAQQKS
jgi:hypothetical protein